MLRRPKTSVLLNGIGVFQNSQLVLKVITAAVMAAELNLMRGDIDGVFWATSHGLKVLGAHEELFSLRMRAHGLRGDFAGVRFEFVSYK